MKINDAIERCPVRGAIYRTNDKWKESPGGETISGLKLPKKGTKIPKRYYKNHPGSLIGRIPMKDTEETDWEVYDPRDDDNGSLFMYND
jgi:hypothetical protein